ncbi:MAG: hypothetical protein U0P45_03330 [Acidimicrobiales bacterium]
MAQWRQLFSRGGAAVVTSCSAHEAPCLRTLVQLDGDLTTFVHPIHTADPDAHTRHERVLGRWFERLHAGTARLHRRLDQVLALALLSYAAFAASLLHDGLQPRDWAILTVALLLSGLRALARLLIRRWVTGLAMPTR